MNEKCVRSNVLEDGAGHFSIVIGFPSGEEAVFDDIFADREEAEELSERINRGRVSIHHIHDVMDDCLTSIGMSQDVR